MEPSKGWKHKHKVRRKVSARQQALGSGDKLQLADGTMYLIGEQGNYINLSKIARREAKLRRKESLATGKLQNSDTN